jgi:hypothetical protein
MAANKTRPVRKTAVASAAAKPAAGTTIFEGPGGKKQVMPAGTKGVPLKELKETKDMSPEAVRARRSEAQRNAPRMVRTTTVAERAKAIEVEPAAEGDATVYNTMKDIWSSRGEIVTDVAGVMVEVKRSDVIRTLQQLPRDAKSPLKLVPSKTDELVHILEGA